jgi:hypothetical protein
VKHLLDALQSGHAVVGAELRPPRAELAHGEGMDAWIDTYHAVRSHTRRDTYVFLTDSAVGAEEEDNLRHLVTNLGSDVPRSHVVPFLTAKHPLDYCLRYAERAAQHEFPALVVLGGDKHVGAPRCVEHARELRQRVREHAPGLILGGWANPHAGAEQQVDFLLDPHFTGEFFLTQIVSHHHRAALERFLNEAARRGLTLPGVFGVFYYRSARPATLQALSSFLPVPIDSLGKEFGEGTTADEVCARSIRALLEMGVRHVYISNLPIALAQATLARILNRVGLAP